MGLLTCLGVGWTLVDIGWPQLEQLCSVPHVPRVSDPPAGWPGHVLMALAEEAEIGKRKQAQSWSAFQFPACVMSANIPLARASHMTEFSVRGQDMGGHCKLQRQRYE